MNSVWQKHIGLEENASSLLVEISGQREEQKKGF